MSKVSAAYAIAIGLSIATGILLSGKSSLHQWVFTATGIFYFLFPAATVAEISIRKAIMPFALICFGVILILVYELLSVEYIEDSGNYAPVLIISFCAVLFIVTSFFISSLRYVKLVSGGSIAEAVGVFVLFIFSFIGLFFLPRPKKQDGSTVAE